MAGWDDPERGAARYDRLSQRAGPLLVALGAALDFHNGIGRERIEARVRELATTLRDRLAEIPQARVHTSTHPALGCGLTGFALEGLDRRAVVDTLWRRHHVWVRHTDHDLNTVRVSTHLYNTEEQVERLIEGVRDILANGVLPPETA